MYRKIFAFCLFLTAAAWGNATNLPETTCPEPENVSKTGQTYNSFTFDWDPAFTGAQYRLWYVKDGSASGFVYTYNLTYTFSNLSAGNYTFYFQTVCSGESSSYIGVEDWIL
ncbi:MAG: fibronectin type III domain-containing protein [Saprospiraceae bacterium]|nr:fibronectin type III domain-containing protein [Saprospiraceae bacterium]